MSPSSPLFTLALVLGVQPAFAITVTTNSGLTSVPGQCSLRDAITAANTNAPVASCAAGAAGLDTIELPAGVEILLTQVDNSVDGPTGLPVVIEPLILHGNGSAVTRPAAIFCDADGVYDAGEFRLLSSHAGPRLASR